MGEHPVEQLQRENDLLRRLLKLRPDDAVYQPELTAQENEYFALLKARSVVADEAAITHLYGLKPECDWPEGPENILRNLRHRMRRKLKGKYQLKRIYRQGTRLIKVETL